jgi:cbb3-type cytochrome oxidase cytochrome c subunit
MNYGPLIFLAAFFALSTSWFGLVLTPQMQVGQMQQTNTVGVATSYPTARPGLARQGMDVYRANGCAACHSQQLGQTTTLCDVLLTEAGTNQQALVEVLNRNFNLKLDQSAAKAFLASLPKPVLQAVGKNAAESAIKEVSVGGAKAQLWIAPRGPDIARGWGKRRTVAEDFLYDYPVMLGSQRVGPDLADVGARRPDITWHLIHLYAPRCEVKNSTMAPYHYLFDKRKLEGSPSPDALPAFGSFTPPVGYEIIPKPEALALAAYLVSLRTDAPIFPTPMSVPAPPPPATTNAPGTPVVGPVTETRPKPYSNGELLAVPESTASEPTFTAATNPAPK